MTLIVLRSIGYVYFVEYFTFGTSDVFLIIRLRLYFFEAEGEDHRGEENFITSRVHTVNMNYY